MKKEIEFIRCFNGVAASELDDILEWLQDKGFLSVKGANFRAAFWEMFIKE